MPDTRYDRLRRAGSILRIPLGAVLFLMLVLRPSVADAPADAATPGVSGRLAGSVEVGPELTSRRIRFSLYPEMVPASALPAPHPDPAGETANVVVYLEKARGATVRPAATRAPYVMRQEGMTFHPHVLAIRTGSTVEFPNGDPIFHNVFSLSRGATFDLGRYPEGRSKSVTFDRPGVVKVFCHIHSEMSGIIMVFDHPWFAIPGGDGRYQIDGVPPGEYRVVAWHERTRPLDTHVTIEPGHTTVLDFKIPLNKSSND